MRRPVTVSVHALLVTAGLLVACQSTTQKLTDTSGHSCTASSHHADCKTAAPSATAITPTSIATGNTSSHAHGTSSQALTISNLSLPTLADTKPREYPGLHNAVAYHDGYISGSVPEGEKGFASLQAMGIKTIISVDGMVPEVELAKKYGLRYIHLPIGYNGFDETRKKEIARASRDALTEGPVYIHCHHGKHRSAGAAAAAASTLGWLTPDEGVSRMKVSGTAAAYTGLFACARAATPLDQVVIDAVPANFPAISRPSGFVQGMVDADEALEHLTAIEKAGWKAPADHPDLVPVNEAGRLADILRILAESDRSTKHVPDFAEFLRKNSGQAQQLEDALAAGKDNTLLNTLLKAVNTSCKECHIKHRNEASY